MCIDASIIQIEIRETTHEQDRIVFTKKQTKKKPLLLKLLHN